MKVTQSFIALVAVLVLATVTVLAGPLAEEQRGRGGRGGRGGQQRELTPDQQEARAEALARNARPMEALDSVWLEELTVTEVPDYINAGMTTALILTGGVEANGPHLAQGKHNYVLRQTGESIARALGNALIAPIVTLEPSGRFGGEVNIGSAGPTISQETYLALLTDMGDSLRAMGFKNVLYLGDSGSNRRGMQGAANALNTRYKGEPANFYHIPEYYDYRSVQLYIRDTLKISEMMDIGTSRGWADGLHEDYGIDALMALENPETIRFEQRVKAGRAIINGVPLEPLEKLLDHGRQFVELRTRLTVEGIKKALAGPPVVYGQRNQ